MFGFEKVRTYRNKGKLTREILNDYVVIDIETTGLSPDYDEIIEFAGIKVENNVIVDKFEVLIKPKYPVSQFITSLTGITNELLENQQGIENVIAMINTFIDDNVLLGHNVSFDINFLFDNFKTLLDIDFTNDYMDTMSISRKLFPQWKNHKLKTVCEELETNSIPSHRAINDCISTFEAYIKMKDYINENHIKYKKLFFKNTDIKTLKANKVIDENSLLYGKSFVFTGKLEKMDRKSAWQLVVDRGGEISKSISKKVDYLVLGNFDYVASVENKSSKQIKAEDMILKGTDIKIISENVFYDMIEMVK